MDVSVIIVSYNTRDLTLECVRSIFEKTEGVDFEVIVVDNASIDGSPLAIRSLYPEVKVIESSRNVGFGAANNLGARSASGRYIFLLNSDTYLVNNAIREFYEFATGFSGRLGAVGTMLEDENGRATGSYSTFPCYARLFRENAKGLLTDMVRTVAYLLSAPDIPRTRSSSPAFRRLVDYIEGADLFIPRAVFVELSGFDERYFLGVEEVDLQYRMMRSGYARAMAERPRIVHLQHRSAPPPPGIRAAFSKSHAHNNKGIIYFLKKNRRSVLIAVLKVMMTIRYLNPVFVRDTGRNHVLDFIRC